MSKGNYVLSPRDWLALEVKWAADIASAAERFAKKGADSFSEFVNQYVMGIQEKPEADKKYEKWAAYY